MSGSGPLNRAGAAKALLEVHQVSKKLCAHVGRARRYALADMLAEVYPLSRTPKLRPNERWVLQDLSFSLGRGEALAIAGRNGAGKSTLLKMIAGILKPNQGSITLRGRVAAMLELGTGFSPLLTGRENVETAASAFHLDRRARGVLMERVKDFADIGDAFDAPLQSYSSGMRARLAYAIEAHLGAELLLIDEVLAVGDYAFQLKCMKHLRGHLNAGGALVLVSHNVHQVQSICERAIVLDQGRPVFDGDAVAAMTHMLTMNQPASGPADRAPPFSEIRIDTVEIDQPGPLAVGGPLDIAVRCEASKATDAIWCVSICTVDNWVCITSLFDTTRRSLPVGVSTLRCRIPRLPLAAGSYLLRVAVIDADTLHALAFFGHEELGLRFTVEAPPDPFMNLLSAYNQLVQIDAEWN
jgi:ABC-type polysaccharide/polyol phosphate transport system ATPase subunit